MFVSSTTTPADWDNFRPALHGRQVRRMADQLGNTYRNWTEMRDGLAAAGITLHDCLHPATDLPTVHELAAR
jgi:hypothetical protein